MKKRQLNKALKEVGEFFIHFVLYYASFLYIWLTYEHLYNHFVLESAMGLYAWHIDMDIVATQVIDKFKIEFMLSNEYFRSLGAPPSPFTPYANSITFNIPMTLAGVVALIIMRGKSYKDYLLIVHVLLLLFMVHFIYIYTYAIGNIVKASEVQPILQQYLAQFSLIFKDASYYEMISIFIRLYVVRFEPFIMMVYVWGFLKSSKVAHNE